MGEVQSTKYTEAWISATGFESSMHDFIHFHIVGGIWKWSNFRVV